MSGGLYIPRPSGSGPLRVEIPAAGWSPQPHQMPVWTDMERQITNLLLIAHRRFGKDELGLNDCATRAAQKAANYFYMLPEGEHVRRSIWTSINPNNGRRRIDEAFPYGFRIGNFKEQEMVIDVHAAGGKQSRVQFLGSDNYDAIVGASPFGLYFSEWSLADPQALAMLRPIIGQNGGYVRFLTTARGKNHAYKQLQNKGKPDWAVHYLTVKDTKIFTDSQLKGFRDENIDLYGPEVGDALYQQEYFCSFEEIVPGSFYIDLLLKAEIAGRIAPLRASPDQPIYVSFDIGWADATALWYSQILPDNSVDIIGYEEYYKTSIVDLIPRIRAREGFIGALLLPHDARQHQVTSGVTVEDILTRAGFTCYVMPQTDEAAQVQSVRMLLPRCNIDPEECERGLECLKHYHNKPKAEKGGGITWSPNAVHDWSSHAAKSIATLAYFAPSLRRGAKGGNNPNQQDAFMRDRKVGAQGGSGWMK